MPKNPNLNKLAKKKRPKKEPIDKVLELLEVLKAMQATNEAAIETIKSMPAPQVEVALDAIAMGEKIGKAISQQIEEIDKKISNLPPPVVELPARPVEFKVEHDRRGNVTKLIPIYG